MVGGNLSAATAKRKSWQNFRSRASVREKELLLKHCCVRLRFVSSQKRHRTLNWNLADLAWAVPLVPIFLKTSNHLREKTLFSPETIGISGRQRHIIMIIKMDCGSTHVLFLRRLDRCITPKGERFEHLLKHHMGNNMAKKPATTSVEDAD